jgi:hypothetical protein
MPLGALSGLPRIPTRRPAPARVRMLLMGRGSSGRRHPGGGETEAKSQERPVLSYPYHRRQKDLDAKSIFAISSAQEIPRRSNLHLSKADGFGLRDLFAAIQPVLYVQNNGVPDIFHGFLISIALGVTALQFRGEGEVSVSVFLYHNRETIDSGLGADYLFGQVYLCGRIQWKDNSA